MVCLSTDIEIHISMKTSSPPHFISMSVGHSDGLALRNWRSSSFCSCKCQGISEYTANRSSNLSRAIFGFPGYWHFVKTNPIANQSINKSKGWYSTTVQCSIEMLLNAAWGSIPSVRTSETFAFGTKHASSKALITCNERSHKGSFQAVRDQLRKKPRSGERSVRHLFS